MPRVNFIIGGSHDRGGREDANLNFLPAQKLSNSINPLKQTVVTILILHNFFEAVLISLVPLRIPLYPSNRFLQVTLRHTLKKLNNIKLTLGMLRMAAGNMPLTISVRA